MFLEVLSPGWMTTVQDLGRVGYERYGIPRSGAMDWFSLRAANRLVGNSPSEAGLEFLSDGPVLRADEDCLVTVTGRGFRLVIHDRPVGTWRCALVRRNETIRITAEEGSGWGYLAVNGGVMTPPVMGSRSTYLRGGLGGYQGRVLQAGDRLPVGGGLPRYWQRLAGRAFKPSSRLLFFDDVEAAVVPGPQYDVFFEPEQNEFYQDTYQILPTSDRMGYRLSGPAVQRRVVKELVSEGIDCRFDPGTARRTANNIDE